MPGGLQLVPLLLPYAPLALKLRVVALDGGHVALGLHRREDAVVLAGITERRGGDEAARGGRVLVESRAVRAEHDNEVGNFKEGVGGVHCLCHLPGV